MPIRTEPLADADPEIAEAISAEDRRQEDHIELIASENYTGRAVMEAQGSSLTNKYAEGYPISELAEAISAEDRRQEDHIELIASENYTGRAVMEAQGSSLTNKYAEGYP